MSQSRRVVLILQARMGSTRRPGKSLLPLAGAPLAARIVERVKRCARVDGIVLATTQKPEDDALEALAQREGIGVFRGSEHDLLDRYVQAARAFGAEVVARLPADNPGPEPEEIDRIIGYHLAARSDFSSNLAQVLENGYPDGIGAEVMDLRILEQVSATCRNAEQREHVHLSFFNYRTQQPVNSRYRVGTVLCPPAFRRPDLVLDVNTPAQYEFMAELYDALYPRNPRFHITDIVQWYDTVYAPARAGAAR